MAATSRRRVLALLGVVLGIALVPALVLTALGRSDAATMAVFGALTALVAGLTAGWRVAVAATLVLAGASAVAVPLSGTAWAAALLLASVSAVVALTARRGQAAALLLIPISLAFTVSEPPMGELEEPQRALIVLAITAGAGLFATVAGRVGLPVRLPEAPHVSRQRAAWFAVQLGLLVVAATWVTVAYQLGHTGAWLIMTILIVVQPYLQDGMRIAVQRALGTVLGFAVAMAFIFVTGWPVVLFVAGGLFMFAALVFRIEKRPYWQYAALLTPAIVLLEGGSGSLADTAWQRLLATVLGAVTALALMAMVRPLYQRAAQEHGLEHW